MTPPSLEDSHQHIQALVSVVLPSLNQAALLASAVESVLSQSHTHIELIVVDGGSNDATLGWLAQRCAQDTRLRFISQLDAGPADAINKAFRLARGTVIGWLNADEAYAPGAVQRALQALQDNPSLLLVSGRGENAWGFCPATVFFRRSLSVLMGPLNPVLKSGARLDYCQSVLTSFEERVGFVNAVQALCLPAHAGSSFGQALSLGNFCHAATALRQLEYRAFSSPFDWIFSKPEVAAHALADDFKSLLDPTQFEPVPIEQRVDPHSNRCEHKFYRDKFGQRFLFNHHSPDQADDLAYFQRAVVRFRQALCAPQPCLLLMVDQEPFKEARYQAVIAALNARGANYFLLLVNFVVKSGPDHYLERVTTLAASPHFLALELAVSARSDGVAFANPQDTASLAQLLKNYRVKQHPRGAAGTGR